MKMVSQLTRQAMSRHRLISVKEPPAPASCAPAEPVRPLYAPPPAAPAAPPAPVMPRTAAPAVPRPKTIYQQLMVNHDRMRERHLHRT